MLKTPPFLRPLSEKFPLVVTSAVLPWTAQWVTGTSAVPLVPHPPKGTGAGGPLLCCSGRSTGPGVEGPESPPQPSPASAALFCRSHPPSLGLPDSPLPLTQPPRPFCTLYRACHKVRPALSLRDAGRGEAESSHSGRRLGLGPAWHVLVR